MSTAACLVGMGFLLIPGVAHGACSPSLYLQQRLQLSQSRETALGAYNRGLDYFDEGCLEEAQVELRRAAQVLEAEPSPGTQRKELLGLARAGLDLARAQSLLKGGQQSAGLAALFTVFDRYGPSVVTSRALLTLAPLLPPSAPEWSRLGSDLEILSNMGYWQATKAIAAVKIGGGKAADAVSYLESHLRGVADLQRAHAIRILLADAYRANGRVLEAWLLIRAEDSEAAEEILDWQLRVEFLRVAAAIARARTAEGDDDAAAAARIYEAALREVAAR